MNIRAVWLAVFAGLSSGLALAETIVIGDRIVVRESNVATPDRGMTMSAVEKKFGAPTDRHPTVGQPPITRWDYQGFSVFFERDRVIHSVARG